MLSLTVSVPVFMMPPPSIEAVLPLKVLLLTVSVPVLKMPPPLLFEPSAMVNSEMETVPPVILKSSTAFPPSMLSRFAPGPVMFMFLPIVRVPLAATL